jgi:hemin uptake protein HemP
MLLIIDIICKHLVVAEQLMSNLMPNPLSYSAAETGTPQRPLAAVRIRSDELLRGAREIVIEHRGEEYRLLRTRNDRLILNK